MAAIILPDRWKRQPRGAVEVDTNHWLYANIIGVVSSASGVPFEHINRNFGTRTSTVSTAVTKGGLAVSTGNAGAIANIRFALQSNNPSSMSLFSIGSSSSGSGNIRDVVSINAASNTEYLRICRYGIGGYDYLTFKKSGIGERTLSGAPLNDSIAVARTLLIEPGAVGFKCHTSGATYTATTTTGSFVGTDIGIVVGGTVYSAVYSTQLLVAALDRAITIDEHNELESDPWQIFKPRKRILYFDAPSFPVLSSLAVSNITSSGGRLAVS